MTHYSLHVARPNTLRMQRERMQNDEEILNRRTFLKLVQPVLLWQEARGWFHRRLPRRTERDWLLRDLCICAPPPWKLR